MRRSTRLPIMGYVLIVLIAALSLALPAAAQAPGLRTEDGRVLPLPGAPGEMLAQAGQPPLPLRFPGRPMLQVLRSPDVAPAEFVAALKQAGFTEAESTSAFGWWRVAAPEGLTADEAVAQLLALPAVAYADEDRVIQLPTPAPAKSGALPAASSVGPRFWPNDPYLEYQWHMPQIGAPNAWSVTMGSPDVMVAVIDSGFDYHHPDRPRSLLMGYDFANGDTDAYDDLEHGTHVAGIVAAATNNGVGVAGICPDCTILVVKVLDLNGGAYSIDVASAIEYSVFCAQQFGKRLIINLSLGSLFPDGYDLAEAQAISRARETGALIVASSGNARTEQPAPWYAGFPANYDGVMSVASTDADDQPSSFSYWADNDGYGLAAPGRDIWALLPLWTGTNYGLKSGTSMAAPMVAGAAGLVWSEHPNWTADHVAQQLIDSVDEPLGWSHSYGAGRLNVYSALQTILSLPTPVQVGGELETSTPSATPQPTASLTATATATATASASDTPTLAPTVALPTPTPTWGPMRRVGISHLPMIWCNPPLPGPSPTPGGAYPFPSPGPSATPAPGADDWIDRLDGEGQVWSYDGRTYLGLISSNRNLPESIINRSGAYGSLTSETSISNPGSAFGSSSLQTGARDPSAPFPPVIWLPRGPFHDFVGFVSLNQGKEPRVDPDYLVNYLLAKERMIGAPPLFLD